MYLCLIRHGETTYNIEERMQGVLDVDLTPKGQNEAKLLGEKLRSENIFPNIIFSSPVKRALETAKLLNYNVPIITKDGFRARNLGYLEGLTKMEIEKKYPGAIENITDWNYTPPGSNENPKNVFERAANEIKKIFCEYPSLLNDDKPIIIVTHSGVIDALIRKWLNMPGKAYLPFPLKNAAAYLCYPTNDLQIWKPMKYIEVANANSLYVDHS